MIFSVLNGAPPVHLYEQDGSGRAAGALGRSRWAGLLTADPLCAGGREATSSWGRGFGTTWAGFFCFKYKATSFCKCLGVFPSLGG